MYSTVWLLLALFGCQLTGVRPPESHAKFEGFACWLETGHKLACDLVGVEFPVDYNSVYKHLTSLRSQKINIGRMNANCRPKARVSWYYLNLCVYFEPLVVKYCFYPFIPYQPKIEKGYLS